jgi:hypothetical protein
MKELFQSEEVWLVLTNIILAVSALICAVVIVRIAFQEIRERRRIKSLLVHLTDDKTFVVSNLGITMADGGKRVSPKEPKPLVVTGRGEIVRDAPPARPDGARQWKQS